MATATFSRCSRSPSRLASRSARLAWRSSRRLCTSAVEAARVSRSLSTCSSASERCMAWAVCGESRYLTRTSASWARSFLRSTSSSSSWAFAWARSASSRRVRSCSCLMASVIAASAWAPLMLAMSVPLRDGPTEGGELVLRLEAAGALHAERRVLDDAVVELVGDDALESGLVHPHAPGAHLAHLARLLRGDGHAHALAVRADGLDDDVVVARRFVDVRD